MTDRKYTQDSNRSIERNRSLIKSVADKGELLKTELALERRAAKLAAGLTSSSSLEMLQEDGDRYTRKIEAEKQRVAEMEMEVLRLDKLIDQTRHKRAGADPKATSAAVLKKQVRMMENRLDKDLVRYNDSLAHNRDLRNEIEDQRRQRVVYDSIYKKLERQLHEKKKELAATIERSKEAYAARDKAQLEIESLKQRAEKEQAEFEVEWQELGKLVESDRDMKDQMRAQQSASVRAGAGSMTQSGDMSFPQGQVLQRQVSDSSGWGLEKAKAQLHVSQDAVQAYEDAFEALKAKTEIDDMDELVAKFVEAEDRNFSLFNFVNELNSEIERLEAMTAGVKAEAERYKGQGMSSDVQRKKILHSIEQKLAKTQARALDYETKYQAANKTLSQLKTGIHSIFTRIGCATSSVEEMLGNQGVTESNVMQYLGIIEERTTNILRQHKLNQAQAGLASTLPGADSAPSRDTKESLRVQPPGWDDMSDGEAGVDEQDDDRPFTRDELHKKVEDGVTSKSKDKKKSRLNATVG